MGTQTMGSQGGGGGSSSGRSQEQIKSHALLGRQGSLYSLTLDEVEHQLGDLGKPLSSMNLDELLKSVWGAEANQGIGIGMGLGMCGVDSQQIGGQVSPSTLGRDLSKKTVDEVWQDIIQQGHNNKTNILNDRKAQERQPTLGEMTLEDFLVKAGVVAESSSSPGIPKKNSNSGSVLGVGVGVGDDQITLPPQQAGAQWMHYQQQQQQQQQQNMLTVFMPPGHPPVQQALPIVSNPIVDAGAYPETHMNMSPSPLMGTPSDTQTLGRKRVAPGDVIEKTVERRQKRMIKNRESAARSRARKQAYTHELENKVSRLEEENERLKRQKFASPRARRVSHKGGGWMAWYTLLGSFRDSISFWTIDNLTGQFFSFTWA
ncbi:ABSCISIC ACID-INSENSITIVE 5-like protein 2 isoform X2 [Actinidia eriantha]|uniref:ABSCISIC ACID-INSENSITIVE 5-like protein 2 isoform X2 n=1 Tax=Actinidia eriantha TaxID=165200 RepID=UPI002583D7C0|nr:ABSCISIC ACID-INSENSITIVE 5-like protein 2 isoform X2 [Actinidia eriantha]